MNWQKVWKGYGLQVVWASDSSWFITDKKDCVNHIPIGVIFSREDNMRALAFIFYKLQIRFGWTVKPVVSNCEYSGEPCDYAAYDEAGMFECVAMHIEQCQEQ